MTMMEDARKKKMEEKIKERRLKIAFIIYLIAIPIIIIESFIASRELSFTLIIGSPMIFSFLYMAVSSSFDNNEVWQWVIIFGLCVLGEAFNIKSTNYICTLIDVSFFVIEVILAMIVKSYNKKFIAIEEKNV